MAFKPIADLARWTRIALFSSAAFYVLSAAALPGNLAQLDRLEAEERALGQQILIDSTPSSDFAGVGFASFLLTSIVFLVFFHRAYSNLAVLGPSEQRWSAGWSVGSWFIPIFNLFRPKQIANDIWRGSDGSSVPAIFHWWWAFWLLGGAASYGIEQRGVTVSEAKLIVIVEAVGESLAVVGALLAAAVVRLIARRQHLRASLIGERERAAFLAAPERITPQAG
jgi:Domain of unknown function (DUF4328)